MTVKKVSQAQIPAPQKQAPKADMLVGTKTVLSQEEIAAVDRICEIQSILTPEVRAALKEEDKLKKLLASAALEKFPAEEVAVLVGNKGRVEFNEETHAREIKDMHGLIGVMKAKVGGYEKLLPFLKVNLGSIDDVLSKSEAAPFIGEADEGSRRIKGVYPT